MDSRLTSSLLKDAGMTALMTTLRTWIASQMLTTRITQSALLACLLCASAVAQEAKPTVDAAGTITTVGGKIPFSSAASKEALRRFQEILLEDKAAPGITHPLESRKFYDKINTDRAERMKKLYPVRIEHTKIGGVPVDVVSAADVKAGDERVLINLHGGAFLWGAGSGGLVEAIPVASVSKIMVITVDYREGPEDRFPAANEDVEKVYRAVLEHHGAENVGIYGCSAGGGLTAQAMLWFTEHQLPLPAAIGVFCAGIWDGPGDSQSVGPMFMGQTLPKPDKSAGQGTEHPYFKGQAFKDFAAHLSIPGVLAAAIAKFPPTLLISGTRDMELSEALVSNEMLSEAGVTTELHVWEGMWHSFFSDPELPESKAAYAVMARFFERHLGHAPAATREP